MSVAGLRPLATTSQAVRAAAPARPWSRLLPNVASPLLRSENQRAVLRRSTARSLGSVAVRATLAGAKPAKVPAAYIPKNLHGFDVVKSEYISEYDAVAVLYKHKKTGAEASPVRCDYRCGTAPGTVQRR